MEYLPTSPQSPGLLTHFRTNRRQPELLKRSQSDHSQCRGNLDMMAIDSQPKTLLLLQLHRPEAPVDFSQWRTHHQFCRQPRLGGLSLPR